MEISVLEWAGLFLHLLKLMNSAKHAESCRATAAPLVTTLFIGALGAKRIIELAVYLLVNLLNRWWIRCAQSFRKGVELVIILEHLQPGRIIFAACQAIRP